MRLEADNITFSELLVEQQLFGLESLGLLNVADNDLVVLLLQELGAC